VQARSLAFGSLILAVAAFGQETAPRVEVSELDLETYRYAISAERRTVMEANLGLDVERRMAFFKIYDECEKERGPLDRERLSLLRRYVQSALSDPQAMALVRAVSSLQVKEIDLRARCAGRLEKALGGRVGARYYQVDDVVTTATRLNSLQSVPLVGAGGTTR
jgi:hypothetical protein